MPYEMNTREVHCFCFKCGTEWVSPSSAPLCVCEDPRIVYYRPCVEFDERIDAAYKTSDSSKYLGIEEVCVIECDGSPSTIYGLSIPVNTALITRSVIDFEKYEVYTHYGVTIDLQTYYNLRDFGY